MFPGMFTSSVKKVYPVVSDKQNSKSATWKGPNQFHADIRPQRTVPDKFQENPPSELRRCNKDDWKPSSLENGWMWDG